MADETKAGPGRPRADDAPRYPRALRVYPASDAEAGAIAAAAARRGLSVSAYLLTLARADVAAETATQATPKPKRRKASKGLDTE